MHWYLDWRKLNPFSLVSQKSKEQIEKFLYWKELGNWETSPSEKQIVSLKNPLCGDEIHLALNQTDEGIQIVSLNGEACSVCLAAAGLLYSKKHKWKEDSLILYENQIKNYLDGKNELMTFPLDEVEFWEIMKLHPGRHRCAFLPLLALKKSLQE